MKSRITLLALAGLSLAIPLATETSEAGTCGGEGQAGCGIFATDCARPNLIYDFGAKKCVHPPCGRDGEAACVVTQRVPSCHRDDRSR